MCCYFFWKAKKNSEGRQRWKLELESGEVQNELSYGRIFFFKGCFLKIRRPAPPLKSIDIFSHDFPWIFLVLWIVNSPIFLNPVEEWKNGKVP